MTDFSKLHSQLYIRELLEERGMKVTDLAKKMNVSLQYMSNLINGRGMSVNRLIDIADALDVDLKDLFTQRAHKGRYMSKDFQCPHCGENIRMEIKVIEKDEE